MNADQITADIAVVGACAAGAAFLGGIFAGVPGALIGTLIGITVGVLVTTSRRKRA